MKNVPKFIRDEILLALGLLVTGFALLALLGFALTLNEPLPAELPITPNGVPAENQPVSAADSDIPALILTFIILTGGLAMIGAGIHWRRKEKDLGKILAVLRAVESITIPSLAVTAGVSNTSARRGAIYLISRNYVALRFDAVNDLVIQPVATAPAAARHTATRWQIPEACNGCGAPTRPAQGWQAAPVCDYCGARLQAKALPSHPSQTQLPAALAPGPSTPQQVKVGFDGSIPLLIVLFIFCWPAAVIYLILRRPDRGRFLPP